MKKTQVGWAFILILAALMIWLLWKGQNRNILIGSGIFFAVILLLFYRLTIIVTDTQVKFIFGVGLIRGTYDLKDIRTCRPINYTPLGWGIRFRPGVTLYNVSGNRAIELELKNRDRKIWLGTNSPEEVAAFINEKMLLLN